MSLSVYSESHFHITWHTKDNRRTINERVERPLYKFLEHSIIETAGAILHAIGGIEDHMHIAVSLEPSIHISDWIGKLKGASSYYINHEIQPKLLQWQRGYGIVTFGTKDLPWVVKYVLNQKEHHKKGSVHERLERVASQPG